MLQRQDPLKSGFSFCSFTRTCRRVGNTAWTSFKKRLFSDIETCGIPVRLFLISKLVENRYGFSGVSEPLFSQKCNAADDKDCTQHKNPGFWRKKEGTDGDNTEYDEYKADILCFFIMADRLSFFIVIIIISHMTTPDILCRKAPDCDRRTCTFSAGQLK